MNASRTITMAARGNGCDAKISRVLSRQRHRNNISLSSPSTRSRISVAVSDVVLSDGSRRQHHCHPRSRHRTFAHANDNFNYNNISSQQHRYFSDNLLGFSPMSRSNPNAKPIINSNDTDATKKGGAVWGTDSNTAGGGVWAQTSAKRDKLNELLTELRESSKWKEAHAFHPNAVPNLDEAATLEEGLDLELADGLKVVAGWVDGGGGNGSGVDATGKAALNATAQLFQFMDNATSSSNNSSDETTTTTTTTAETTSMNNNDDDKTHYDSNGIEWNQWKFEASMKEAIRILSTGLPPEPPKKPTAGQVDVNHPLCYIRDFMEIKDDAQDDAVTNAADDTATNINSEMNDTISNINDDQQQQIQTLNQITTHAFASTIQLYRALLLRATAQTMLDHWATLTAVSSGDVDRAAVSKDAEMISSQRSTIQADKICKVMDAYANGNNEDWVQSWWELMDADNDGRLDEEEMVQVVDLAMKPVHLALGELMGMALEVCPARRIGLGKTMEKDAWFLSSAGEDITNDISMPPSSSSSSDSSTAIINKLSWKNRRAELRARRTLAKTFQGTLATHFRDQAETPHRLRCIYAWAEKSHQDNKVDSILVDASEEWGAASSIVGRKRYVELMPKISLEEFRDVQKEHFPHLDRVGEDILTSFKEDLWVLQGKGRQNRELRRDCFLFLLGVSLVDLGIIMV